MQQGVSEAVTCYLGDKMIRSGKNNWNLVQRKFRSVIFFFHFYTVQKNKIQSETTNYLHSCLLFIEIKF